MICARRHPLRMNAVGPFGADRLGSSAAGYTLISSNIYNATVRLAAWAS